MWMRCLQFIWHFDCLGIDLNDEVFDSKVNLLNVEWNLFSVGFIFVWYTNKTILLLSNDSI